MDQESTKLRANPKNKMAVRGCRSEDAQDDKKRRREVDPLIDASARTETRQNQRVLDEIRLQREDSEKDGPKADDAQSRESGEEDASLPLPTMVFG